MYDKDDPTRINGDDIMHSFVTELAVNTAAYQRPLFKHETNAETEILVVDAGEQERGPGEKRIGAYWIRLSNGQEFILEAREFGLSNSMCPAWHRLGVGPETPWPGISACTREQGHDGPHLDRHGNDWAEQ